MSSPMRPGATPEEELEYYKKQYEQLETDLADFQTSSKELEEQLERDIESAEKNERKLKEQVESLTFQVEEWKSKHKQSKTEGNSAQNVLQKEITTMRESNRALQMKLRDIEVMNDDYERQARNTESSLEDMEGKFNVAIERSVLLEEEMKSGEQEREALRIETQRLRDELSELKIENEITSEKLRLADATIERLRSRKPSPLAVESLRARSPASEASGITPSPTASTPPPKSETASDVMTPPSPPLSDAPVHGKPEQKTPMHIKRRSLIPDTGATPRPGVRTQPRHTRGPSTASSGTVQSDAKAMKPLVPKTRPISRPSILASEGLPRSDSLHQIRSLRGRMQKIEERVQSARSKLPAPRGGTPRNSPRTGSALGDNLPSSVTMRRSMRRPTSNFGSNADGTSDAASETGGRRTSRIGSGVEMTGSRESAVKRLSFGIPRPASTTADRPGSAMNRPPSAAGRPSSRTSLAGGLDRPPSATGRPISRTSLAGGFTSIAGLDRPPSATGRPSSRTSLAGNSTNRPPSRTGAYTPLSSYAAPEGYASTIGRSSSSIGGSYTNLHDNHTTTTATKPSFNRSNSSISGTYSTLNGTPRGLHRPSASVSELRWKTATENSENGDVPAGPPSPTRRSTMDRSALRPSFMPAAGTSKRQSGGIGIPMPARGLAKRTSTGFGTAAMVEEGSGSGKAMGPPPSRRKMSDVGETY